MGSGREVHMSKNTSFIWQISFNGQRCDLQIHHCFLNDSPIACSWYIKNRKKPRSWSFYFLFKIFQTRDIIHSEKSGICSDGNRKLGFACCMFHLSDKRTLLMKTHIPFQIQYKLFYRICFCFYNGEETTDSIISKMLSNLSCLVFDRSSVIKK
jgi:hypothetical protein